MIAVTATLRIYADNDEIADEILRRFAEPTKGATIHVLNAQRVGYQR